MYEEKEQHIPNKNLTYFPHAHLTWSSSSYLHCNTFNMSASGSTVNFNFKIFNLGARRGGDVHFLIARLYITVLCIMYVEKAYSTVDGNSSVGWGR